MDFGLKNNNDIIEFINTLRVQGVNEISIKPLKQTRRLRANNLYWEWITIISEHTGDNKNSLHEIFKEKFLFRELKETSLGSTEKTVSTSKLSVKQFYEYMLQIEIFCSEFLEIKLPQPNQSDIEILFKDV